MMIITTGTMVQTMIEILHSKVLPKVCGFFLYRFWVLNEEVGSIMFPAFFIDITHTTREIVNEIWFPGQSQNALQYLYYGHAKW